MTAEPIKLPEGVILSVRNLAVGFHTDAGLLTAVDDVSFDLNKGSILGLVGESGCGKSVTCYALMRLLEQPQGKILRGEAWLKGISSDLVPYRREHGDVVDMVSLPQKYLYKIRGRKVAMIFQDSMTSLNPVHRVGKQLAEVYKLHFPHMSKSEVREAMVSLLKKVQIPDPESRLENFPHQLSGGMRQRVMIAIALACRPDVLIADEPTTALDVTVQDQILGLIKDLQAEIGMSIILISHDFGVIAQMCDEVVVMYAGRVAEKGSVDMIIDHPQHPYTKGLLASIPRLSDKPKTMLPIIEGSVPPLRNMIEGCRFSNRCPLVSKECAQNPALRLHQTDHLVACHKVSTP